MNPWRLEGECVWFLIAFFFWVSFNLKCRLLCLQRDVMKVSICWYEELADFISKVRHPFPLFKNLLHQWLSTTTSHRHPVFSSATSNRNFCVKTFRKKFNMFPGNGAAKNSDKGKAKMGEQCAEPFPVPAHQINTFTLHGLGPHFASPNTNRPHFQQILNTATPMKPFSYMSLLTASDDEDDNNDALITDIKDHCEQIDHMILLHSENLRQALGGTLKQHHCEVHRGIKREAKKHKEREMELMAQNMELERMVEHYKGEAERYKVQAERMNIRLRYLERAESTLREQLQEANAYRHYAEVAQEEAESSFQDPDRVGPILLECKVCVRQLATVMLWPCRHVCVCTRCLGAIRVCPVCRSAKTDSVEVHLPIN